MNGLIGLCVVLINFYICEKSHNKGIILYCILLIVMPVSVFWGVPVDYEILSFPIVLFYLITRAKKGKVVFRREQFFLLVWYAWLLMTTMISQIRYPGLGRVSILSFIGMARCVCVYIFLCREKVIQEHFVNIIRVVMLINVFAIVMEYILSLLFSPIWAIQLWMRLYGTIGNSGALAKMMEYGKLDRFFGTFASSAFLGTLSILGVIIFWDEYKKEGGLRSLISLFCSLLCGIAASSKRFYLGIAVFGFIYFFVNNVVINKLTGLRHKKINPRVLTALALCLMAGVVFFNFFKDMVGGRYYLDLLLKGKFLLSLQTRFGMNGAVSPMRPIIREHAFIGVGNISIPNLNASDSQFYITLFMSGGIGLALFITYFWCVFRWVIREKNVIKYLVFAVVVFEFIISTQFFSALDIFLISFLSGTLTKKAVEFKRGMRIAGHYEFPKYKMVCNRGK